MKSDMEGFEMADGSDPESIIAAAQRSICSAMAGVIADLKVSMGDKRGIPGLTWEQIDYFIEQFKNKQPIVINQEREL